MKKKEFIDSINACHPDELAENYLNSNAITAFQDADKYLRFKERVKFSFSGVEFVSVVGNGNWQYSLNPFKEFKEFDDTSDIDVAVISPEQYNITWEELRKIHRSKWYTFSQKVKEKLRRNSENIYSGFISPIWIPVDRCQLRYDFRRILNKLSDKSINYKPVKMLFFKNYVETIDYYKRGFINAKTRIQGNEI